MSNLKDFSAYDLRWENVIFRGCAAWSYHCLQKHWYSLRPNFLYSLNAWCVRNVQNCTDVPQGGLNFIETVYELFDNPFYTLIAVDIQCVQCVYFIFYSKCKNMGYVWTSIKHHHGAGTPLPRSKIPGSTTVNNIDE